MPFEIEQPLWSRRKVLTAIALGLLSVVVDTRAEPVQKKTDDKPSPLAPPLLGNPQAPKKFILWGSYTCVFTAQAFPILTKIVLDNPDKVNLEWHHFPLHAPDPALHVGGLGFDGLRFWSFTRDVLGLVLWAGGDHSVLTKEILAVIARKAGGSEEMLQAAYADKEKWDVVKNDFLTGKLLGIKGTPAIFYDGYFLTPDGLPNDLPAFEKSLREMIKQA